MNKLILFFILSALCSVSFNAMAATGNISADPETVFIGPGQSQGSTLLTWSTSNVNIVYIHVACGNGPETLVGSAFATGSLQVPWITIGSVCTFSLRAESQSGTLLDTVSVRGEPQPPPEAGDISASPETVSIPLGQSVGTTTLSWTSSGTVTVFILVSCNSQPDQLVANMLPNGTLQVPWIAVDVACTFKLRANTQAGPLLDSVVVHGVREPSPSTLIANPTVVIVPAGQQTASTLLSWVSDGVATVRLTRQCAGEAESLQATGGSSGSYTFGAIREDSVCVFRTRSQVIGGPLLASTTVRGYRVPPGQVDFATLLHGPAPSSGAAMVETKREDICAARYVFSGQQRVHYRNAEGKIFLDNVNSMLQHRSEFLIRDGYINNVQDATIVSTHPQFPAGATYTLVPPLPLARLLTENSTDLFTNWVFEYCRSPDTKCQRGTINSYQITHTRFDNDRKLRYTEDYRDSGGVSYRNFEVDLILQKALGYWASDVAGSLGTWTQVCPAAEACSCVFAH